MEHFLEASCAVDLRRLIERGVNAHQGCKIHHGTHADAFPEVYDSQDKRPVFRVHIHVNGVTAEELDDLVHKTGSRAEDGVDDIADDNHGHEVGERDDGLIRFQPASACDLKQQKRDDHVRDRTEHHEQKTVEHRVAQRTVKRDRLDNPLEVCKATPVAAEDALGEFIILERNDDCGSHRYIVEQDISDDLRDTQKQQLTAGFCICPAFVAKARPFLFSFLCHGSHGFLRFCFLHCTGSVFDFQGAIVTRWLAIVTALIVHYSCIQLVSACLF